VSLRILAFALLASSIVAAGCRKAASSSSVGTEETTTSSSRGATGTDTSRRGTTNKEPTVDPNAPPAFTGSSDDFVKEILVDEKAAIAKYEKKWIVLEGKSDYTVKSESAPGTIYLDSYYDQKSKHLGNVGAEMAEGEWPRVDGLTHGQPVKIRGLFRNSINGTVQLENTKVLDVGPDPAVVVSAAQITKEYADNKQIASDKYSRKQLLVEGVVFSADAAKRTLVLEGFDAAAAKPVRVEATLEYARAPALGSVKKGDKVTIKGMGELYDGEGVVKLTHCKVVK
jgi:hypothetical protein